MAFSIVENISGSECIGSSRPKIVNNFVKLETHVLDLSSNTIRVNNSNQVRLTYSTTSRRLSADIIANSLNNTHLAAEAVTTTALSSDCVTYSKLASISSLSPLLSTEAVQPRVAKAWVTFNGDPITPTIYSSFNISSVSKSAPGSYQINFNQAMSSASYAVAGLSQDLSNGDPNTNGFLLMLEGINLPAKATNFVKVRTWNATTGAFTDATDISVIIY